MDEITVTTDAKTAARLLNLVVREVHRIDKVVSKNGLKPEAVDDIRKPMILIIEQLNTQGVE